MTKIIHQTWKTNAVPADVYPHVWQQSWVDAHPGWDYILWTDSDNDALVRQHYPQMWDVYNSIDVGVVRADIARVLHLHRHGGIYADLDFVCLRSFDPLLSSLGDFIVVGRHNQKQQPVPNAWMYSPPGCGFWLIYADDSLRDWRNGQRKVEAIAGPDRMNWALDKYSPEHVKLPPSLVYPFAWGNEADTVTAGRLDWLDIDALRATYSRSLAVTRWTHNW